MMRQIETAQPKEAENSLIPLETLQNLQKEIILKSADLWRSIADDRRTKVKKFKLGLELHETIIHAMRLNPDLVEIEKLRELCDQVEKELEIAKKRGL